MQQTKTTSALQINQVQIQFTAKSITAWGGIGSVIASFLTQIDFRAWVLASLPVTETSPNAKGLYEKVLALFLTVLCGGERFSHLGWWGHGVRALQKCFDVSWLPGHSSTLTRFFAKFERQSQTEAWAECSRSLASRIVRDWARLPEDTLNLDSTVLVRYGEQEGAVKGYNPRKPGRPSQHPLLAFLGSGYVVNFWNRAGNAASGQSAVDFLRQTVLSLGKGFRVKGVQADVGFYRVEFVEYLESESLPYVVAAPLYPVLQKQILRVENWRRIAPGIEVGEFFFEHEDEKWMKPRRYVVVRQETGARPKATGKQPLLFQEMEAWKEYRFSLHLTNRTEEPPEIWRQYRSRANDENVIKDLKEGYGLDHFNLHGFWATEAVLTLIALVFHNLLHYLGRRLLSKKPPHAQLKTLRGRFFILPAQLGRSGRQAVLRLAVTDRSLRAKLRYVLEQIKRWPKHINCIAVETG